MLKRTKLCTSLMIAFGGSVAVIPAVAQQTLERVEITGSSIKRIDAESALPVQIITREQIAKTGATNVEQLLQTIASISSSGGLTAASASGATTGGISAVSLHGLTSLRTLVLVNGRRIAPYGVGFTGDSVSVDVNSIPLAAIERVEVLRDGASAVYGSDAIAGVINFILRQDFKGLEITGEYGDTTRGGANFKRASGAFGFGDLATDRFNVMAVASYQKEGSLFGRDRDFAKSGIDLYTGSDATSGNTFPGNIAKFSTGGSTRNPTAPGCPGPYALLDPFFPATRCRFDPSPYVTLIPASDRMSIFASGKFAITPDIQAYAEGGYNQNKIRTIIQPVPLSDQFALPAANALCSQFPYNATQSGPCQAAFLLTPASQYYPTAYATAQYGSTPDLLVRYRSEGTGPRDLTDISEAPRFVVGVKGAAVGWDFDAGYLYTQSKVREQVNSGFPAYGTILPLLNSGTVNPFGPSAPSVEAALAASSFKGDAFNVKSTLQSLAAKASRDVFQLSAGPVAVAFGGEARNEKFQFTASPTIQTGDISGYGGNFLNTDKTRKVTAVFGEVNIPIIKNLDADLAVRYDHYEGVGNSTTPKASLRWQPMPEVLLRTSWGRGFRAPSLLDLYLPVTTGVSNAGLSDPVRCPVTQDGTFDCSTQFNTTNGGNPALKPEKSINFSLGAIFEPVKNVSVGIDYFRVQIKDTLTNGVPAGNILQDVNSLAQFGYLVTRAPATPADIAAGIPGKITNILQTNINIGVIKVSGWDADITWRIPAGDWGKFTLTTNGEYFSRYDSQNTDGTFSGGVGTANTSTGGVTPRIKTYTSADWVLGPWNVTLSQLFQLGYGDIPSSRTGALRNVSSYTLWDLQGTYSWQKSWKFTLGAKNLFDKNPPYSNVGGQTQFQAGYDAQYGDPRGRFLYGRVTYSM